MPRQGQSVEACTIVRWLKQPGEDVGSGEVLCEIETDKAAFEVESTASGTLLAQFVPEGEEVPVLTPIAAVGEPGEEVSAHGGSGLRYRHPSRPAAADRRCRASEASGAAAATSPGAEPPPGTTRSCRQRPRRTSSRSGWRRGPGRCRRPPRLATRRGGPAISPRARRRADELGVDYSSVRGSGPRGRIIERDVVAAASQRGPRLPRPPAPRWRPGPRCPRWGAASAAG